MNTKQLKKQLILNIPYIILGLLATNLGEAWRIAAGANASEKPDSAKRSVKKQGWRLIQSMPP